MVYYLFVYSQQNRGRFFTNYPETLGKKSKKETDLFASEGDAFNFALAAIPPNARGIIIYQATLKSNQEKETDYLRIKYNHNNTQSPVYWSAPSSSVQIESQINYFAINPGLEISTDASTAYTLRN